MKRVLCTIGTRPEVIKLAPVITAMRARPKELEVVVAAVAQHREILDAALDLFGLVPDHDLDLMRVDQRQSEVISGAVSGVAGLIDDVEPDVVLVQGDTTSALGAALAAFYAGVRVAHVEAGLRSGDVHDPFPEEANRKLTDQVSDFLFAPTERAARELIREGFDRARISVTGNTVIDTLVESEARLGAEWKSRVDPVINALGLGAPKLLLATAHRRESFGPPLRSICAALGRIAERADVDVVFPVHPNPNVQDAVMAVLGNSRVKRIPPVDYASFCALLRRATLVLSDSGGVQEEAAFLGKPTLVMRNKTERPEAIEAGVAALVGTSTDEIVRAAEHLLDDAEAYAKRARPTMAFGDGRASERIAERLARE